MEIVHSRCAGMDVSKRDAKVCLRVAGKGRRKTVETVRTWSATTNGILALREHLINEQVSLVVMEATGDYWKPFVRHEALVRREALGVEGGARPPRWAVAAAWWELSAVRPGRRRGGREAALTKPERSGTARRVGFGERDQRVYERNQW
jgi:hypothetical protein